MPVVDVSRRQRLARSLRRGHRPAANHDPGPLHPGRAGRLCRHEGAALPANGGRHGHPPRYEQAYQNARTHDLHDPYTDIRSEGGFEFKDEKGNWRGDGAGRGPLFRDPYPLSRENFLVSHKPAGADLNDPKGYGIYLLDGKGNLQLVYRDPEISCWVAYPLQPRKVPPVLSSSKDAKLAAAKLAKCVVTDVYHGLEDVPRGTIKYIRVLEQRARPWAARRYYDGDLYDQQHAVITKDTHLALKVQHGVVPVEEDGSAYFLVPADASIFFQVLDANFMAVQTERTFVNYMAGEVRACIGCHETPQSAMKANNLLGTPLALKRAPSTPGPQQRHLVPRGKRRKARAVPGQLFSQNESAGRGLEAGLGHG